MAGINKAVSDSTKDIIIDPINKIRNIKKRPDKKVIFPLLLPIQQTMNKN